ncbi:MAG: ABC transporter ATP-binding protein [Methanomassiliicoccales archaeon]
MIRGKSGGDKLPEAVIEVEDLVKRYGQLNAVDGISFRVEAGEVFSILGPNGAGKTTTVEILESLRDLTSGEVRVLGHDLTKGSRAIIERIGVLPQRFDAYDLLTVRENIRYFAQMFDSPVDEWRLIETVALEDKADSLFKTLSGGMKQRVGVAISLVNDPALVFLDEPTTGLDPRARREVWEVIRSLRERGKTVILTTHYMEEAEALSDRVAIMNQGRFIALGSPQEIIERHGGRNVAVIRGGGKPALELLGGRGEAELKGEDVHITLENKRDLGPMIAALEEEGMYYEEIMLKRSNLEEVFLSLTGKKLVEGELSNG